MIGERLAADGRRFSLVRRYDPGVTTRVRVVVCSMPLDRAWPVMVTV